MTQLVSATANVPEETLGSADSVIMTGSAAVLFAFVAFALILFAFALTALLTGLQIPFMKAGGAGQSIREDGPRSHLSKDGTPTMGGIAIIAGTLAVCLLALCVNLKIGLWRVTPGADASAGVDPRFLPILVAFVGFGLLGFADDYVKVEKKRNLGLTAGRKLALQVLVATIVAVYAYVGLRIEYLHLPGGAVIDLGPFIMVFHVFVIVAAANSVNLTDGLDGLASGVSVLVALFFVIAGAWAGLGLESGAVIPEGLSGYGPRMFCAALAGACLGFLVFNRHPARIFMGDTGSLAIGGALAATAIMLRREFALAFVGFVYVAEAASVILQVGSYKLRKKRIFRMSPLHHHFELGGMPERVVVRLFWGATAILCVIGLAMA